MIVLAISLILSVNKSTDKITISNELYGLIRNAVETEVFITNFNNTAAKLATAYVLAGAISAMNGSLDGVKEMLHQFQPSRFWGMTQDEILALDVSTEFDWYSLWVRGESGKVDPYAGRGKKINHNLKCDARNAFQIIFQVLTPYINVDGFDLMRVMLDTIGLGGDTDTHGGIVGSFACALFAVVLEDFLEYFQNIKHVENGIAAKARVDAYLISVGITSDATYGEIISALQGYWNCGAVFAAFWDKNQDALCFVEGNINEIRSRLRDIQEMQFATMPFLAENYPKTGEFARQLLSMA
jgi:hypothetical protein